MKQCPTCHSIINAENTCPICNTSLVYEPSAHADEEHIVFNRFYGIYLLKTLWFSVVSFLVCGIRIIGWLDDLETLCVPILLFCTASVICGLIKRHMPRLSLYTKDAHRAWMVFLQYISATTALVLALFPIWM